MSVTSEFLSPDGPAAFLRKYALTINFTPDAFGDLANFSIYQDTATCCILTPAVSVDSSFRAYYCPYQERMARWTDLGDRAKYAVTHELDGCRFVISRGTDVMKMGHIAAHGKSSGGAPPSSQDARKFRDEKQEYLQSSKGFGHNPLTLSSESLIAASSGAITAITVVGHRTSTGWVFYKQTKKKQNKTWHSVSVEPLYYSLDQPWSTDGLNKKIPH